MIEYVVRITTRYDQIDGRTLHDQKPFHFTMRIKNAWTLLFNFDMIKPQEE